MCWSKLRRLYSTGVNFILYIEYTSVSLTLNHPLPKPWISSSTLNQAFELLSVSQSIFSLLDSWGISPFGCHFECFFSSPVNCQTGFFVPSFSTSLHILFPIWIDTLLSQAQLCLTNKIYGCLACSFSASRGLVKAANYSEWDKRKADLGALCLGLNRGPLRSRLFLLCEQGAWKNF